MKSNGTILQEAFALINTERQQDYGTPAENFTRIAFLWSMYLGVPVTAKDVCICMTLLKIAREAYSHKHDNILDAAAYLGLASDMEGATCV